MLDHIEVGNEMMELPDYEEGFYFVNDTLWLVDKDKNAFSLWGALQNYFNTNIIEDERAILKRSEDEDASAVEEDIIDYKFPDMPLDFEQTEKQSEVIFSIEPELFLKALAVAQDPSLAFKE